MSLRAMTSRTRRNWLGDKSVYPLFAIGAAAVGLSTYYTGRLFVQHPDIVLNTKDRAMTTRDNHDYGDKFTNHGIRKSSAERGLKHFNYDIMHPINKAFTTPRAPGSY